MCDTTHGKGCPPVCGKVSHMFAALLWLLGVLALVAAWVATKQGSVWGLEAGHWYQDVVALALLGLLAGMNGLFHALKKKGSCSGSCGGGEHQGEEKCGCGGAGGCGGHDEKK